jgi:hypothetical protein
MAVVAAAVVAAADRSSPGATMKNHLGSGK